MRLSDSLRIFTLVLVIKSLDFVEFLIIRIFVTLDKFVFPFVFQIKAYLPWNNIDFPVRLGQAGLVGSRAEGILFAQDEPSCINEKRFFFFCY